MGGAPYKFAEKGSGALSNVSEFSHKRALMSCFDNLMSLKQIIEQTAAYKFMFSSYHWHHIMLYYLWCHCEHGESGGVCCISYTRLHGKYNTTFFTLSNFECASLATCWCDVKLTPGLVHIQVNFDPIQEIGEWVLFEGGCSLARLWYA